MVLARDPRPQAHRPDVPGRDLARARARRHVRAPHAHRAADAVADHRRRRDLQPLLHPPRRDHGVAVHDPVDPDDVRQLPAADHDRRRGRGVPAPEPGERLRLRRRRGGRAVGDRLRRRRHRLDVLSALQHPLADGGRHGRARRLHPRHLDDHDRHQLHRHHAYAAREGPRLGTPAAVRVGDLRHQHHPGPGDAGPRA